jgi:4-hydroxybenzoate polyprenyltransferase
MSADQSSPEPSLGESFRNTLKFIRFSHTIFAMPFALGSLLAAAGGLPSWRVLGLVILAMVFARTAAMAYNRFADWEIDMRNPRTAARHKLVSRRFAWLLVLLCSLAFVVTTYFINPLCYYLSPVALLIIFFYSLTKRFTSLAQLFLGLALSVAPVGAWLAVTGSFAWPPLVLALGVVFWVAGFDIIYATQDYAVDMKEGLRSMVTWLGIGEALIAARVFHAITLICLIVFGLLLSFGWVYWLGMLAIAAALVYEHTIARGQDLHAINKAFFTSNAIVGLIFVVAIAGDLMV